MEILHGTILSNLNITKLRELDVVIRGLGPSRVRPGRIELDMVFLVWWLKIRM